jgi:glycosyltransferase involved in cell wall biosynthesis
MEEKQQSSHVALYDVVEKQLQPRVSVVIPVRNEDKNLYHVLPNIPSFVSEVILVDGHLSNDTIAVARRLYPSIRIIKQIGHGKGMQVNRYLQECLYVCVLLGGVF